RNTTRACDGAVRAMLMSLERLLREERKHQAAGRVADAKKTFRQFLERAARSAPNDPNLAFQCAHVAHLLGQTDTSIKYLRLVARLQPSNAQALIELGRLLGESGKLDEAIELFQRAATLHGPDEPHAHHNLGVAHLQRGEAA